MGHATLHEAPEALSPETVDMHRALASLIEELEAVDWYSQRIDASDDDDLCRILAHNRDEEKEHACMTLEWIRRRDATFDAYLRKILFRDESSSAEVAPAETATAPSLGIGPLRPQGTGR